MKPQALSGMFSGEILAHAALSSSVRKIYRMVRRIPGAGRVSRALVHRVLPAGTRLWVEVPDGLGSRFWLRLDPRYELTYVGAHHEPEIQALLRRILRRGDVFYDIGAHIGFFSILAAGLVGSEGAVVCFEPDPDNYAHLRQNIVRNGLSQVRAINVAVWSQAGPVTFYRAVASSSRNRGTVTPAATLTAPNQIQVAAVTLDGFVMANMGPTVLKIDVEGGEMEVLKGAVGLLSRWRPLILCEIHSRENWDTFRTMLTDLGYSIRPLSTVGTVPFPVFACAQCALP